MAAENAKAFIEKMNSDPALRAKLGSAVADNITEIAREAGFDTDAEEIERVFKQMRSESGDAPEEITPDQMDQVAGGAMFCGEDAPDEHEMGCTLSYHHYDWQKENDIWCNRNYYCNGNYGQKIDRTKCVNAQYNCSTHEEKNNCRAKQH